MLFSRMIFIYPGALDGWFGLEVANIEVVLNRGRGLEKEENL